MRSKEGWTLALFGDLHSGHPFALHPDTPTILPDDEAIAPNRWQLLEWEFWLNSWDTVAELRRGRQLIVCHNGDAIEGIHHGTTQLMTMRKDVQERIHYRCMQPVLDRVSFRQGRDRLFYITGTEPHVGPGSSTEERIARTLLDIKPDDNTVGSYVKKRLLLRVGGNLISIAHHGPGRGARNWLRGNNLRWFLKSYYLDCLETKAEMPRFIVRSHRHQSDRAEVRDRNFKIVSEAFTLPGWQLKTEFVYRLNPDGVSEIGLLVIQIDPDGSSEVIPLITQIQQDEEEELTLE